MFTIWAEAFSQSAAEETFSKRVARCGNVQVAVVAVLKAWSRAGQRSCARHFQPSPSFLTSMGLLPAFSHSLEHMASCSVPSDCAVDVHKLAKQCGDMTTDVLSCCWGRPAACWGRQGQCQRYGETLQMKWEVLTFLLAMVPLHWPSQDALGLFLSSKAKEDP